MAARLKPWTDADAPDGKARAVKNSTWFVVGFFSEKIPYMWCAGGDGTLFVSGLENDAFPDEFHIIAEIFGVGDSVENFPVRQSGCHGVVGVLFCLSDFVGPEFGVVGDDVDTGYWDLVDGGGAGADGEFAEVVDLPDFLFLRDSKSSGGNP